MFFGNHSCVESVWDLSRSDTSPVYTVPFGTFSTMQLSPDVGDVKTPPHLVSRTSWCSWCKLQKKLLQNNLMFKMPNWLGHFKVRTRAFYALSMLCGSLVTTAWCVLRLRKERRQLPDTEGSYKCQIGESQQMMVLQIRDWLGELTTLHHKIISMLWNVTEGLRLGQMFGMT
jgi:hypothetical protein